MDETEADRPAQAADRRRDRPEERSPGRWPPRKREVEADGLFGKSYPARLHGSAFGRSHGAGHRRPETKPVSSEAWRSAGPGDRREARMPLPARAEHAAETRPRVPRDERPKSGDMGTGSNAGPLLRFENNSRDWVSFSLNRIPANAGIQSQMRLAPGSPSSRDGAWEVSRSAGALGDLPPFSR